MTCDPGTVHIHIHVCIHDHIHTAAHSHICMHYQADLSPVADILFGRHSQVAQVTATADTVHSD